MAKGMGIVRQIPKYGCYALKAVGKKKIFCIGRNKTGTTSLKKALENIGVGVGHQRPGELLIHDWARGDFRRLFIFCRTAQAFQDVPFNLPFTYMALDKKYRESKFILTARDSSGQWYESLVRSHSKLFGNGNLPDTNDLKNADYCYKGYMYDVMRLVYGTPDNDPYNKDILIAHYERYNKNVLDYFRHREKDLLVLNVSWKDAYERLHLFLDIPFQDCEFPWENRT